MGAGTAVHEAQDGSALPPIGRRGRGRARRTAIALATVLVIVVIAVGLRTFAVAAFVVPSGSMQPTLQSGDRIAVDKLATTIHRGDIVVFHRAPGDPSTQYPVLVKRVVGLPGETISWTGDRVMIDGKPIHQPWLPKLTGACTQGPTTLQTVRIPAGRYFVMGDCRGLSYDSRAWGTVPAGDIIGKVSAVIWRHDHPWMHWF